MPPPETTTAVATRDEQQLTTLQDQILAGMQAHKGEIRAFLPNEDAQRRFMRIVIRALAGNERLQKATPESIVNAAIEAAVYGLEPSGDIGGAHLVPFSNDGVLEAVLITDYRGDVHLARQSKEVSDAYAEVVRESDRFVDDRAQATVIHEPNLSAKITNNPDEPGNRIVAAYACVVFKDGFRRFVVMSRQEIDAIRAMAPGKNSPAWRNHYPRMAVKTVLKRALKTAPLPPAVRDIISREDRIDYSEPMRGTVEKPSAGSLTDRLAEQAGIGTTEQPGDGGSPSVASTTPPAQDQPAVPAVGEAASAAGGEADLARVSASPSTEQPEGASADMDSAEGAPAPVKPEASGSPPAAAPPVDPREASLKALLQAPSAETFLAFGAVELGIETALGWDDLTEADTAQVVAGIAAETDYATLFKRFPAIVKANIRRYGHAPNQKRGTTRERPTAEQLQTALGGDTSS